MNASSNDDDFGENPFRTSTNEYYDTNSAPVIQPQFQQSPQQQFPQHGIAFMQTTAPQSSFPPTPGLSGSMMPQQEQASPMEPQASRGCWGTFLMLIDLNTYKAYFDVDAEDIVARIRAVCLDFYKPEHFRNNVLGAQQTNGLKGPDLYGPFWVTMTLIFLVGVCIRVMVIVAFARLPCDLFHGLRDRQFLTFQFPLGNIKYARIPTSQWRRCV